MFLGPRFIVCSSRTKTLQRALSTSLGRHVDFTHAVIGGGVVGLAVARKLQEREGTSTVLIEKHRAVGTETSSRNSEVIHASLYYPPDSLKTQLCLKGKHLLYDFCSEYSVPYRRTGKWIVAQDSSQMEALDRIHAHAKGIGVPTRFLSSKEMEKEPGVTARVGVLASPSTGIVDSHTLMQVLQGLFEQAGGITALMSKVSAIRPLQAGHAGWEVDIRCSDSPSTHADATTITASTLINAAGLYAIPLANTLLPPDRQLTPLYAKGTYYSLASPLLHPPKTLVYPAPVPGHAGLGTHLTLDLSGRIRFGPDVEWTDSPTDYTPTSAPDILAEAIREIKSYLADVQPNSIVPDYVGIRPKMGSKEGGGVAATGKGGQDFVIREEEGFSGWINLLGIESPGLTSALAIGEETARLLYR